MNIFLSLFLFQLQIDDAIEKLKQQRLLQLCEESGVSLAELDSVVQPIIESCTKEAISVCIIGFII